MRNIPEAAKSLATADDARLATVAQRDPDMIRDVAQALAAPIAERDELQRSFDLRWKADMRAIKMWQLAGPNRGLTWPDHADLVVFLLNERDAEWNKALAECRLIVRRHEREFPAHLRGELEDAINALRRPDPALNNPDTPGEDIPAECDPNCDDPNCPYTHTPSTKSTPTIEELRAKVVEAAIAWVGGDTFMANERGLRGAVQALQAAQQPGGA